MTGMSTQISPEAKALQDQHRDKGNGQFGHQLHDEDTSVMDALNAALAGAGEDGPAPVWPEAYPEPELRLSIGDAGVITTDIYLDGELAMEVFNPADDVHSVNSDVFEFEGSDDDEAVEAARAWAEAKHDEIAWEMRREMRRAYTRVKDRALSKATGKPSQLTDEDLLEIHQANKALIEPATRDAHLSAASIVARGVLAAHPDASYFCVNAGDERPYDIDVLDKDQNHIMTHYSDEAEQLPWIGQLHDLDVNRDSVMDQWDKSGSPRVKVIDLSSAVAWSPGQ